MDGSYLRIGMRVRVIDRVAMDAFTGRIESGDGHYWYVREPDMGALTAPWEDNDILRIERAAWEGIAS